MQKELVFLKMQLGKEFKMIYERVNDRMILDKILSDFNEMAKYWIK